jgi:protein SCO1/2
MDVRRLTLLFGGLVIVVAVAVSAVSVLRGAWNNGGAGTGVSVGGDFSLLDHEGRRVGAADFRGRHMLVYFGYTSCPDVCPNTLLVMSEALDLLGQAATAVQPVFITIDPERDTPEVLAEYRRHFHPSLVALTGSPADVAEVAEAYRIYLAKAPGDDADDYLLEHSSLVFLMDGAGRYLAHFGAEAGAGVMAARIRKAL